MIESSRVPWPEPLPLPLVERRGRFLPRGDVLEMESGRRRSRRLHLEPLELLEVRWNFTENCFDAFVTFFHEDLANGSLAFTLSKCHLSHERYGLVFEQDLDCAFLDAQYDFVRSDNLVEVTATLLVLYSSTPREVLNPAIWGEPPSGYPPWQGEEGTWEGKGKAVFLPILDVAMGYCNRSFILSWGQDADKADRMDLEVETSPGSGEFEPLVSLSQEELRSTKSMDLLNIYGGRKLRAKFVLGDLESAWFDATPPDSKVPAPTVSSFSGASTSVQPAPTGLVRRSESAAVTGGRPFGYVDERYQLDPTASVSTPTWDLPEGTELRITSDGSDPDPSSPSVAQDPREPSFSGVYKASAYDPVTGCYSPPRTLVVDKVWDIFTNLLMFGQSGGAAGSCRGVDYHRYPRMGPGGKVVLVEYASYAGDSCYALAGGEEGYAAGILASAIASSKLGVPFVVGPGHPLTRSFSAWWQPLPTEDPGGDYADWGDGYYKVAVTWSELGGCTFKTTYNLRLVPKDMGGAVFLNYGDTELSTPVSGATGSDADTTKIDQAIKDLWTQKIGSSLGAVTRCEFRLSALPAGT